MMKQLKESLGPIGIVLVTVYFTNDWLAGVALLSAIGCFAALGAATDSYIDSHQPKRLD